MIEQLGWDPVVHRSGADRAGKLAPNSSVTAHPPSTVAGNTTLSAPASEIDKAREAFTAMVLQGFLDAAIPKSISGAGQSGAANTMWRSLLVEQLAKTVAASGQFDVLGRTDDARLMGTAGVAPARAGQLTQGKENVNGPG